MASSWMRKQDMRAFRTFPGWAQRTLRSGGTVTGGDGRKFRMMNGHAVVVGSQTWNIGTEIRQGKRDAQGRKLVGPPVAQPPRPRPNVPGRRVGEPGANPAQPTRPPDPVPNPTPPAQGGAPGGGGRQPGRPNGGPGQTGPGGGVSDGTPPGRGQPEQPGQSQADPNDLDGNGVPDYIDAQKEEARRNAFELLRAQFRAYGITDETFFQYIRDLLIQGYDAQTISMLLQEHAAYKERFKGNEKRRGRGLGVLNPSEYIATEAAYAQVLRSLGLPPGFYDDPKNDFADWIGKDVSPQEIMQRGQLAVEKVNKTDPHARKALREFYGITDNQLAAYFLDDKRALPILQKQAAAADIGAAAMRVGLGASRGRAEQFVDLGVTEQDAVQAYGEIADFLKPQKHLAKRHFEDYGLQDAEDELLGGLASARRKRQRINRKEEALFQGASAAEGFSFRRTDAGSY